MHLPQYRAEGTDYEAGAESEEVKLIYTKRFDNNMLLVILLSCFYSATRVKTLFTRRKGYAAFT
jgi:hypothetical protein